MERYWNISSNGPSVSKSHLQLMDLNRHKLLTLLSLLNFLVILLFLKRLLPKDEWTAQGQLQDAKRDTDKVLATQR